MLLLPGLAYCSIQWCIQFEQWPAIVQVRMLTLRSLPDYHNLMPSYSPSPRNSRIREIRYEPFHG